MKFYHSKLLNSVSNVTHAFTLRGSGNLAFHVNDDIKDVQVRHKTLAKELNYDKKTAVFMKQIHSDKVHIVTNHDNFQTPPTCDALITNRQNIPIMVMVADCSPMLFYDKKQKIIAVAHAGRAGAFKNITKNVLEMFESEFKSDTKDIIVIIGASIGVCCYEVGEDIYEEVKKLNLAYAMQIRRDKYYLSVSAILNSQLLACGIKEKNIELSNECTSCNTNKYYSYRAEGQTGRFAGVIKLN